MRARARVSHDGLAGLALRAPGTARTAAAAPAERTLRLAAFGTMSGMAIRTMRMTLLLPAVGALLALTAGPTLNAVALGDDMARGLGQNVVLHRALAAGGAVLLAAGATALAGPIAFVGLVVPHVVRSLVGPDHVRVLPFSMLAGAVLVVVADTVGRVVLPPSEVQVGIMTAVVGVPFFLLLVRRGRMGL